MTDWLLLLFKIGGYVALLALGLLLTARWLLKKITAALESYVTAYAQEGAKIDARIDHLEKLAEEQAKLVMQ